MPGQEAGPFDTGLWCCLFGMDGAVADHPVRTARAAG
jgi:hypothetical protein